MQSRVKKRDDSNKEIMNVLIAEDDLFQRVAIVDLLQLCGFQVIACKNGLEARDELLKNENEFDLILLDLLMPEMGGLDLLKIIKSIDKLKETPVIMMSGDGETDIVAACLGAGAINYLVKPVNFKQFQSLQELVKKKPKTRNNNSNEKGFYEVVRDLGRGAFGCVQLVRKSTDQELYAMKVIPTLFMNEQEKKNAENEVSLLKVLTAPTIIKYYESFAENESLNIIMEYAEGGSLNEKISEHTKVGQKIPKDQILAWMAQLVIAIHFMHSKNILHRDIKTQNMFLNKEQVIKLGDFGISKALGTHGNFAQTFLGTPYFMPPEVIRGEPYGKKADIWALGCALYELVMLKRPFQHDVMQIVFDMIQNKPYDMDPSVDQDLQQLIEKTLQKDPNKRPFVEDLANLPCIEEKINQFYIDHPNETNQIFFKKYQLGQNNDDGGNSQNPEDNCLKVVAAMIDKVQLRKITIGIVNQIEQIGVLGQDILNYLKQNFDKKNEAELQQFVSTLLEQHLIIPLDNNNSQQLISTSYYTFPMFLEFIPANNYQVFTSNSQDMMFILKKLMRKFKEFQRKITEKKQISFETFNKNFNDFFQIVHQTLELQKATMIDYSPQKKLAVYVNIYQLMRLHQSLQQYYCENLQKKKELIKEPCTLLQSVISTILSPQSKASDFSYCISGQITSLGQIKHGILRSNKNAENNHLLPKDDLRVLQSDTKGIFILFIEEYQDQQSLITQELIFLDEGQITQYIQKQTQQFIQKNVILDLVEQEIVIHPLLQKYIYDFGSQRKLIEWLLDNIDEGQDNKKILNQFDKKEFFILFKDPNVLVKY
ncbi:unnamed protein product [Paramecium sonneborni]|uniref:non-specific serine/threonine protein kinase n=1 Tax=Paramecium sonneborni TaxID=65129 RepID=A0A8S1LJB7_9CILI|nr:unnamed protein product [Paramecium sonneborni]